MRKGPFDDIPRGTISLIWALVAIGYMSKGKYKLTNYHGLSKLLGLTHRDSAAAQIRNAVKDGWLIRDMSVKPYTVRLAPKTIERLAQWNK